MTDLNSLIDDAAAKYGENADTAKRIVQIETGGRNVQNDAGGNAAGVFQFEPGTWAKYGNGASPYDVPANVDAGVRLLRDNRAALKNELGRDPTEAELYLAHQQGAAGAAGLITNPDIAAASVVGSRHVLDNGGSAGMTSGQFASKWINQFNGTQGSVSGGGGYVPPTVHYTDLMAPPPVDPFAPNAADQQSAYRGNAYDQFNDALSDAYQTQTIVGNALRNAQMPQYAPDPNFNPTRDQIKGYATDPTTKEVLPPEYMSRFYDATSDAQAKWIAQRAFEDLTKQKRLETLGWKSQMGLGVASTLMDPGTYAIGALTGGVMSPAEQVFARAGRLGTIGFRSLEGGVSNVAITAAMQQQGAPTADGAYLSAAAMGLTLGGAFGAIGRRLETAHEAAGLHAAGASLLEHAASLPVDGLEPVSPTPHQVAPRTAVEAAADSDAPLRAEIAVARGAHPAADPQLSLTGPAEHPEALSTANAPYSVPAAEPAPFSFRPNEMPERLQAKNPGLGRYDIMRGDDAVGSLTFRIEGNAAKIENIFSYGPNREEPDFLNLDGNAHANTFGPRAMAQLARDFKERHPEVTSFAGTRISGARHGGRYVDVKDGVVASAPASRRVSDPAAAIERLHEALETGDAAGEGVRSGVESQLARLRQENGGRPNRVVQRLSDEIKTARETAANPEAQDAGAAAPEHPNVPLFLPAGSLESLREAGQFTSNFRTESAVKSHFLFPASGTQLASSPFAASRIIGAHFAGNPIGYKNAKNPLDVAMQALLMRDRFNGHLDRFLKPAFNEWAHDQGYSQVARLTKKPEFMRQVFDYINTKDETTDAHPAVRRYANQAVRPVMRDWTNEINASGLADHIPYDTTYLPRIFDPGKVGDAYRAHGAENLGKLVKASMADMPWTQALTDPQLTKVANGYAEGISKRALDLDQNWNASWSADNLQHLQDTLVSDARMDPVEAKEITDTVARLTQKDRGANGRLKQRVEMNTEATHAATGSLKMSDLLVKDVGYLMERYNDQMAGRVAMARTKITDPASGDVLQDGIKDDAQFETMIANWKRHLEDQYLSRAAPDDMANLLRWRDLDEANMRFQYGRILSKVDDGKTWASQMFGPRTTSGQVMRIMRKYSFDRMMGATGWSHMSIFGANLANFGVRSALEHVPAFRHVMSQDGEWIMRHGLDRELEAIFGNHADPLRGTQLQDWEHDWGARPIAQRSVLDKIEHVQAQTNKMTAIGSGLAHIIALNKRWAQKGVAQKFADMAAAAKPRPDGTFDLSGVNMRRMMQLGLNEDDMQKVLGQVQQHFTTEPGILFNHKVTKLNLDQWDQETSHIFQGALRRWVDRVVQENDVGSLHRWVSSPLWQMMMQFRNFPMVGHTKQLMYNVAMHDKEAFNYFLTTSAVGAMIYYAREQVNSIGRSDRDQYLQRRLTPGNIAHAALYHSGYAGMMPTMIDTGLRLMGGDPLFDFRTTGNSSALWGAPGVTNVDDMMTAAKAVRRPLEESRDRSQAEARSLIRMFPWSNTLPGTLATNYMIRNMPEKAPREPRNSAHGFDALFGTGG